MQLDEVVDLAIGEPDPAIMPLAELRQAAMHRLSIPDTSYFMYGPEEGSASFRGSLAGFLTRHYGTAVRAGHLLITAGASHALDLILTRLCRPGDTVVVEDPTYFFALDVFADRLVRLVPVPVDADGLDVGALERLLAVQVPRLLYTIPVFQNPTGTTLSTARRRRLVELARRFGFLVVADEVYQLIGDRKAAPPPLRTFDEARVLSLGSFSKILGPGVRLGWVEGTAAHVATLRDAGALRSGGGAAPVMCAIVESAIELGLQDAYLERARAVYATRREHMLGLLAQLLPPQVRFTAPRGGFYVWLELPPGADTVAMAAQAEAAGVRYRPGPIFSCDRQFGNCLRLCFTFHDPQRLTRGVTRLATVLHSRLAPTGPRPVGLREG